MSSAPVYEDKPSGYTSISTMPGRAQGEVLQLRSTLNQQTKTIEEQAKELIHFNQRLADLSEEKGVHNLRMKSKAEIERLKIESNNHGGGTVVLLRIFYSRHLLWKLPPSCQIILQ